MKLGRINALVMRHLYLYKRNPARIMDLFFWPIMELLLWGFISTYIDQFQLATFSLVTVLLGGLIFWDFLSQSQRAVSVGFLEEVWERNFLNIFVTPLKLSEFLATTGILAFIRIILIAFIMSIVAYIGYAFNIFTFGFYLIPFVFILLLFGWALGLFTTAIILRYGSSAQMLAFGLIFLVQPFSAVFYPVSVLPKALQYLAYCIPSTYVFEGIRAVAQTGTLPLNLLIYGLLVTIVYCVLILIYFYRMFAKVKMQGRLLKLD